MSVASRPPHMETAEAILQSAAKSAAEILYGGTSAGLSPYSNGGFSSTLDTVRIGILLDLGAKLSSGHVTVTREPEGWRVAFTSPRDPRFESRLQQAVTHPQLAVALERAILQLAGQAFPREYSAVPSRAP